MFQKKVRIYLCIAAVITLAAFQFSGIGSDTASANNTAQSLPFIQNWTNTGLITVDDDWSAVPGIIGYRGDDASTTAAGIDPRTIVSDTFSTTVQVFANRPNPDTFSSGGTAEFEITNPTVAFQGSGTADYPNTVLYINATGQTNVRLRLNVRDVDGSADDAVQPFNVQYRVGNTGDFINVDGGYFADVTTGGTATQVTPVDVTLPAAANNQPVVQIRLMTTNATGSDEWIGIDDINVTAGGGGTPTPTPRAKRADFDGDGRSDISVFRPSNGTWYVQGSTRGFSAFNFGASDDKLVPGDYDGDGKTDYAVYRPSTGFWFVQGSTGGFMAFNFGALTDKPVPGDYDGDGKTDYAVYRPSTGFWYIQGSTSGFRAFNFGEENDRTVPGDYDGDGKFDIAVYRPNGGFWFIQGSTSGFMAFQFGTLSDTPVYSDFDGDGKTDIAVFRSGTGIWYIQGSTSGFRAFAFGFSSDIPVPADYDGDGKADIAVFRESNGTWYIQGSTSGFRGFVFGFGTDRTIQNTYISNGTIQN